MPGYHHGHWREHAQAKDEHWRQVLSKESRFRFSKLPENHDFRRGLSMYLSKPGAGFNFTGNPLLGVPAVPLRSIRDATTAPEGASRPTKRTDVSRRSNSSQSWRSVKGDQIRAERFRLTGENARLREEIERWQGESARLSRISSSAQSTCSSFSRPFSTPLLGMTKETAAYCAQFGARSYSDFVPTHTEKGTLFKREGHSLAVLAGHPKSRTRKFGNHNYTGYHMATHPKHTKKDVFESAGASAAALEEFEEELALPPNYHMASLGMH